jgi:transcriptional regulator with XRE-family HTH domain
VPSARNPEAIYRVFGRNLRRLREKKGLPQQELATLASLTRSSIANIEAGKQRVLLHQILQFAEALGVDTHELVPSPSELPQMLASETTGERASYLMKLRSLAGETDEVVELHHGNHEHHKEDS